MHCRDWRWLACLAFLGVLVFALSSPAQVAKMRALDREGIILTLEVPRGPIESQELAALGREARSKLGPCEVAYGRGLQPITEPADGGEEGEQDDDSHTPASDATPEGHLYLRVPPAKFAAAADLLRGVLPERFGELGVELCVNSLGLVGEERTAEEVRETGETLERMQAAADDRPQQLRQVVSVAAEATVGDALQTLGDVLVVEVVVSPALVRAHGDDWQAILALPLQFTEEQLSDGMSVRTLILHVCERLGGTARFGYLSLILDEREEQKQEEQKDAHHNAQDP
jgi:hypothetical protein